uniref:Uncharacterized protein n=1 Tax=Meloidogyne incognita TaxID=6306 RepID=A0A914L5E4_MELIC
MRHDELLGRAYILSLQQYTCAAALPRLRNTQLPCHSHWRNGPCLGSYRAQQPSERSCPRPPLPLLHRCTSRPCQLPFLPPPSASHRLADLRLLHLLAAHYPRY